jgi:hypothetical protein
MERADQDEPAAVNTLPAPHVWGPLWAQFALLKQCWNSFAALRHLSFFTAAYSEHSFDQEKA